MLYSVGKKLKPIFNAQITGLMASEIIFRNCRPSSSSFSAKFSEFIY